MASVGALSNPLSVASNSRDDGSMGFVITRHVQAQKSDLRVR